jgi:uncharacterized membrane protein YkoI
MKFCAKLVLATGLVFLCGTICKAQEKKVKMSDLPAAVQATVKEQSKGATLRGLAKEVEKGKTFYEAELTVNGHGKDISMDETGQVVEVEEEVPLNKIPSAAKAAIEKGAAGGKIAKVESVTQGEKLVAYEAQVRKAGKHSEVRVDPNGNPAPED